MTTKGVAFAGNVVPIMAKSVRASDNSFVYRESDVVNALGFVSNLVANGTAQQKAIAAVNMSFIMGTDVSEFYSGSCDLNYPALRDAVEVLHQQGVVVVAGTGNFGNDGNCVFRSKPATDSSASRPPIPIDAGHPFRRKPAGIPGKPATLPAMSGTPVLRP